MEQLVKKHAEKIRFSIVGVANTAVDFGILFLLVNLFGVDKIAANFVSTGIAFIFSFFVNKSFTFKHTGGNAKKQFALFLLVTMTGLWVIQPVIIALVSGSLAFLGSSNLVLLVAKLLASVASLIWNYVFYSRLVFKKPAEEKEDE